jgi:SHAQKYF class myb-like DNA-binding protein
MSHQQPQLPTIDLNEILGIPRPESYSNHQGGFHYNGGNASNPTGAAANTANHSNAPVPNHSSHHALHYALVTSNTPSHHIQHNYHQLPGIPNGSVVAGQSMSPSNQLVQPPTPQPTIQQQQHQQQQQQLSSQVAGGEAGYSQDVLLLVVEQQRRIYHLEEELQRAHEYITKLQQYAKNLEIEKDKHQKKQSRYWTQNEHQKFLEAIEKFGRKDVKSISQFVGTRNATQVRTHAQKYYAKIDREMKKKREHQLAGVHKMTDEEGKLISNSRKKRKRSNDDSSSSGGDIGTMSDDDDDDDLFEDDVEPSFVQQFIPDSHPEGTQTFISQQQT